MNLNGRTGILLALPEELRARLDDLITRKRDLELLTIRECNRQTEGLAALESWIEAETDRLQSVKKPERIL